MSNDTGPGSFEGELNRLVESFGSRLALRAATSGREKAALQHAITATGRQIDTLAPWPLPSHAGGNSTR